MMLRAYLKPAGVAVAVLLAAVFVYLLIKALLFLFLLFVVCGFIGGALATVHAARRRSNY